MSFPEIPIESPFGFVGAFSLLLGIILALAGFEIINIKDKIGVNSGNRTIGAGFLLIFLGIVFLISDITDVSSPITSATNVPSTDDGDTKPGGPPFSTNQYSLIPLDGERATEPDTENFDKNFTLRNPEPIEQSLTLVDYPDLFDPNAPQLWGLFEPDFKRAYSILDPDQGRITEPPGAISIATAEGQEIYIPGRAIDIYPEGIYALVLYASDNSLTFVYNRKDTVTEGYVFYYHGLWVDTNLLELFESSQGNRLPGLTLDTPVGTASGSELLISIRYNGIFMDVRSRGQWWQGIDD